MNHSCEGITSLGTSKHAHQSPILFVFREDFELTDAVSADIDNIEILACYVHFHTTGVK